MKETRILVPETWRRAWMLWWTAVAPQMVLLAMNARWWRLASGEMSSLQLKHAFWVCAAEMALLAANGVVAVVGSLRRWTLHRAALLGLAGAHTAYLWLILNMIGEGLLPQTVSLWIVPVEQFVYYQFALIMPAIFYFLTALACFPRGKGRFADPALTGAMVVGIPLLWWLFAFCRMEYWVRQDWWIVFVVILGAFSLLVMLGALIRMVFILVGGMTERGPVGRGIFAALVAVAAPIGGLILNREIPFPVDFQSWGLYGLTVFNGLWLIVPAVGPVWFRRAIWVGRTVMFPFSCYFFFVFLPFLPLSIIAMLAMGAGFLILTPTVLFLFHAQVLAEAYRLLNERLSRPMALVVLAGGIGLLPAVMLGNAVLDRISLHTAIRYVYHSNPADPAPGVVGRMMLRRSLNNMRDFKLGRHWPFLSYAYNMVVFNGLVLPDEKLQELHQVFFGRALDLSCKKDVVRDVVSTSYRSIYRLRSPPPAKAVLTDLQVEWMDEEECRVAKASLTITNPTFQRTEFAASITLPEGVMISGLWLYIDGERVPARIFDKKTALWVYRMIRDVTRRDPALLYYTDRHHVDLRVFPVEAHQPRQVEIEFLYPANLNPLIAIGDKEIKGNPPVGRPGMAAVQTPSNGLYLVVSTDFLSNLPSVVRRPYLHFIADFSTEGFKKPDDALEQCKQMAAQFPDITDCAITLANYEIHDVTDGLWPVARLEDLSWSGLPRHGGFCRDRAIRHALSGYDARLEKDELFLRYPLVVVLTPGRSDPLREELLKDIGAHLPDAGGFYTQTASNGLVREPWNPGMPTSTSSSTREKQPVVLFRVGDQLVAAPLSSPGGMVALPFNGTQSNAMSYYNPDLEIFQSLENSVWIDPGSRYGQAANGWLLQVGAQRDAVRAFHVRRLLHSLSRESGIMLPGTSYIVVENSAQWKMLEESEKKKLNNFEELEVSSTPEPATWGLMMLAALVVMVQYRVRRRLL